MPHIRSGGFTCVQSQVVARPVRLANVVCVKYGRFVSPMGYVNVYGF